MNFLAFLVWYASFDLVMIIHEDVCTPCISDCLNVLETFKARNPELRFLLLAQGDDIPYFRRAVQRSALFEEVMPWSAEEGSGIIILDNQRMTKIRFKSDMEPEYLELWLHRLSQTRNGPQD